MKEVNCPYETWYYCEICNNAFKSRTEAETCELMPVRESPDIHIGDEVELHRPTWNAESELFTGIKQTWTVTRLFYANADTKESPPRSENDKFPPLHEHDLCVIVERRDLDSSFRSRQTMTWKRFIILRDGTEEQLRQYELIEPPPIERFNKVRNYETGKLCKD